MGAQHHSCVGKAWQGHAPPFPFMVLWAWPPLTPPLFVVQSEGGVAEQKGGGAFRCAERSDWAEITAVGRAYANEEGEGGGARLYSYFGVFFFIFFYRFWGFFCNGGNGLETPPPPSQNPAGRG